MQFKKTSISMAIASIMLLSGCNGDDGGNDTGLRTRTLDYQNSPSAIEIKTTKSTIEGQTDWIYTDGLDREIILRGFNVSGEVKLFENGFQPFANEEDAKEAFDSLKAKTGANIVRYTVSWEGLNPELNKMDEEYMANMIKFMKQAIDNDIYVLVDYHSDLYSRHNFTAKDSFGKTGNGAPKWATPEVFGVDDCPDLICGVLTWSANKLFNTAVQGSMKNFFYNGRVQEEHESGSIPMLAYNVETRKKLSIKSTKAWGKTTYNAVYDDTETVWTLGDDGLLSVNIEGLGRQCATIAVKQINLPVDLIDGLVNPDTDPDTDGKQDNFILGLLVKAIGAIVNDNDLLTSIKEGSKITLEDCNPDYWTDGTKFVKVRPTVENPDNPPKIEDPDHVGENPPIIDNLNYDDTIDDPTDPAWSKVDTETTKWYPVDEGSKLDLGDLIGGFFSQNWQTQRFTFAKDGTIRTAGDMNKCITPSDQNDGFAVMSECINTANNPEYVYKKFELDEDGNHTGNLLEREGFDNNKYKTQKFSLINTDTGTDVIADSNFVQDGFMWQIEETAKYIKANLTQEEFAYVVGMDPINEPFDGGMGGMHPADFDNLVMYPFHQRVRTALDNAGWESKDVYAEPNVFWISVDPIAKLSYLGFPGQIYGGKYLDKPLGKGFVLNSHFYDQARMGLDNSPVYNAAYIDQIDYIRDEGRHMETPTFLSEFGMWLNSTDSSSDNNRAVTGIYQAMESSNIEQDGFDEEGNLISRSRNLDIYTPMMSGTQWEWDYYYDHHREPIYAADPACLDDNGNYTGTGKCKYETATDAWNGENFSVVNGYASGYNVSAETVERVNPRAINGRLLHSAYQGQVEDYGSDLLDWYTINIDGKELIDNTKFSFIAWRGRKSDAPTEIFIPRHFDISKTVIVTADGVWMDNVITNKTSGIANEVLISKDAKGDSGNLLRIWDDSANNDSDNNFALIIEGKEKPLSDEWNALPESDRFVVIDGRNYFEKDLMNLRNSIQAQLNKGKSPVYLKGEMTYSEGYESK